MRDGARIVLLGLVLLTLAACGGAAPSSPATPTPTPTPTASPITSVSVSGVPTSPTVGQSVQLKALITRQDGTALDGTSQVTWQSSDSAVATVNATGLLAIAGPGDADVTATLQNVRGSAHVAVPTPIAPRGTTISGVVHETAPTEDVGVPDAAVGIHYVGCPTCPNDNQTTFTDQSGHFSLPGIVTAGFALIVSKPGYDTRSYGIVQLPRDQQPAIALTPSLTVKQETFSGDCRSRPGAGSATTRFAVHHDGNLVGLGFFGPAWEGFNGLEYRRVGVTTAEPFVDLHPYIGGTIPIPIPGGFFYEIRVSWIDCDRVFSFDFSHPS